MIRRSNLKLAWPLLAFSCLYIHRWCKRLALHCLHGSYKDFLVPALAFFHWSIPETRDCVASCLLYTKLVWPSRVCLCFKLLTSMCESLTWVLLKLNAKLYRRYYKKFKNVYDSTVVLMMCRHVTGELQHAINSLLQLHVPENQEARLNLINDNPFTSADVLNHKDQGTTYV